MDIGEATEEGIGEATEEEIEIQATEGTGMEDTGEIAMEDTVAKEDIEEGRMEVIEVDVEEEAVQVLIRTEVVDIASK